MLEGADESVREVFGLGQQFLGMVRVGLGPHLCDLHQRVEAVVWVGEGAGEAFVLGQDLLPP
ncbi:hypothetical protein [Streptomyces sp. NPDC055134]